MIAAVLVSIEQEVVSIKETEDKILSFLKNEKAATVEGDLKTLDTMLNGYKFNWSNKDYRSNNNKLALDIKRTSEQNIIFYRKQIQEIINRKGGHFLNKSVEKETQEAIDYINYYRMSIYSFAYASFMELLLLGDFNEGYIEMLKSNINKYVEEYHSIVDSTSIAVSGHEETSFETKFKKGVSSSMKKIGGFITRKKDDVPQIEQKEEEAGEDTFEEMKLINCDSFIRSIDVAERIFNRTEDICFDSENFYLIS